MADHDQLLQAVLSGEMSAEDPRIRAVADNDDAFRTELRSLIEAQAILNRAGEAERAVLEEVTVAAAATPPQPPRRLTWVALIAASLLISLLVWAPWSQPQQTRFLGGEVKITAPADGRIEFTFDFALPAEGWFEIQVTDAANPTTSVETVDQFTGAVWRPKRTWPAVVVIEVTAYDSAGDVLDSGRMQFAR